ncbi:MULTISPECIES: hypothetical protein [Micrococcaceae]|jgi:O-antigen/teichoic acid export membrane protein|uniref:hypothetical protein n=1 Tax=Micrococcaceae TaxID=1268 RepID=UPI001F2DEA12|nr:MULTISPECIES: hypothetical protein [Micrococcaceae]MCF3139435.1 hypothetical protein [Paenarthrobacter sp. AR 02]MCR1160474.1 hypothetical protein [Paenarthrobacter sp. UW852]
MTRVRVTAPRQSAPLAPGRVTSPREIAEDSDSGRLFVRSLIRSQLRLALVVACGFLVILAVFALILVYGPGVAETRIAGVPLDWLALGVGVYPVIGLSAWLYNRAAARNEARYRDLVEDK